MLDSTCCLNYSPVLIPYITQFVHSSKLDVKLNFGDTNDVAAIKVEQAIAELKILSDSG